jgi:hypothetical protein
MMEQHLVTILVTLITVLTSNAAWKYYEKRMLLKQRQEENQHKDGELYRDDLRERIVKLETLLDESSKEKDKMRENIIVLTTSFSRLEVEVDFLRKENEKLRAENQLLRTRV